MKDIKTILSSKIYKEPRAFEFLGFKKTTEWEDCIHEVGKENDTRFTTYTRELPFSQNIEITFVEDLRANTSLETTEVVFFTGDNDHSIMISTFEDVRQFINDANRLKKWLKQ